MTALPVVGPGAVRPARHEDVDALIGLRRWLMEDGAGHYVARTEADRQAWRSAYRDWLIARLALVNCVHVAVLSHIRDDRMIVGCGIGIIDERAPMAGCLNGRVGWVQSVVIDPQHRGRGHGRAVMNHLLGWFASRDVGKIVLQTTPIAEAMYEGLGFVSSGELLLVWQADASRPA